MFDHFNARNDGRGQQQPGRSDRARDVSEPANLTDREVPLSGPAGQIRTPALVHAWLDGDIETKALLAADATMSGADAANRGEAARQVEFWTRMNAETAVRREMRTPVALQARIMAALPPVQSAPLSAPWWRRQMSMHPVMAATAAAGLLALGAAVGAVLRSR